MRKFIAFALMVIFSLPAVAVDGQSVKYVGGTVSTINTGAVGSLDFAPETSIVFEHAGNRVTIPYASVQSFDQADVVARHLGVLPAIVVGLLKARQRRHFFRISYQEPGSAPQVAIFEVPKQMTRTLRAVLEVRAQREGHDSKSKPCLPCSSQD